MDHHKRSSAQRIGCEAAPGSSTQGQLREGAAGHFGQQQNQELGADHDIDFLPDNSVVAGGIRQSDQFQMHQPESGETHKAAHDIDFLPDISIDEGIRQCDQFQMHQPESSETKEHTEKMGTMLALNGDQISHTAQSSGIIDKRVQQIAESLKKAEKSALVNQLRLRGLPVQGSRKEMIESISNHMISSFASLPQPRSLAASSTSQPAKPNIITKRYKKSGGPKAP
eukprot:12402659-Karenia_brevis.AAC.1